MYQYLFWDLDGTLTDPAIGITNSIMYALKKFDIEVEHREDLYPFIGPPLMESFQKYYGFDEDKATLAVQYYREYFGVTGLFENEVFDGMEELLGKCKSMGGKLILATSKPEHYAVQIMRHFHLDRYFDCMCGSRLDASYETKADVIRDAMVRCNITTGMHPQCIMIGDRMHDINGAKEVGIKSMAVLWGYGTKEEFAQYGADYVVGSHEELFQIICSS